MLRLRIPIIAAIFPVLVLVASGCSGSDDGADQPAAAAQLGDGPIFEITSPAFTNIRPRVPIPHKYTCVDGDASPPLTWSGTPQGAKSLALIADDPEHRTGLWVHWVLYNIPPNVTGLPEGIPTSTDVLPDGTVQGINHNKHIGYNGPCPPPNVAQGIFYSYAGEKPHKYYFKLYALDSEVGLGPGATKEELVKAMDGHVLAQAEWVGKYTRPKQQGWFTSGSNSPIPNTPTPVRSQ